MGSAPCLHSPNPNPYLHSRLLAVSHTRSEPSGSCSRLLGMAKAARSAGPSETPSLPLPATVSTSKASTASATERGPVVVVTPRLSG